MGDWTQGQVIVHDCPEKFRADVLEVLKNHGYGLGWDETTPTELMLGETYGIHQTAGDNPETVVEEIVALFEPEDYTPGRRWALGDTTACLGCKQEVTYYLRDQHDYVWLNRNPEPLGGIWGDRPTRDHCIGGYPDPAPHRARFVPEGYPDGLVVVAWTDPAYEWLGSLVIQTPVGGYAADCDANGRAMFSAEQIIQALNCNGLTALHSMLGTEYTDYLKPYLPAQQG